MSLLLRHGVLADATGVGTEHVDIRIEDGRIATIVAWTVDSAAEPGDTVVDLDGRLLLPAPAEPHAHLDKAFLAERIDNPTGDLMGAIVAMQENRHLITSEDTIERAVRAVHVLVANGCTAIRTHADTTQDNGLRSVEALVEVRRRVADICEVQVVALVGWPVTGREGANNVALARDAIAAGIDVMGGCPHLEDDPDAATELFLGLAIEAGLAMDLHTDETLDPRKLALADLARRVPTCGITRSVTASHCVSLGVQELAVQASVAEAVAAAGISVITLPQTNLYLQGREHAVSTPRGLTALLALNKAGANVAAGGDNLQDPFNLVGKGDPLETAALMVMAGHYLPSAAYAAVSAGARRAMGLEPVLIAPGAPAELLAIPASSVREAIAFQPAGRIVIHAGRVVAGRN